MSQELTPNERTRTAVEQLIQSTHLECASLCNKVLTDLQNKLDEKHCRLQKDVQRVFDERGRGRTTMVPPTITTSESTTNLLSTTKEEENSDEEESGLFNAALVDRLQQQGAIPRVSAKHAKVVEEEFDRNEEEELYSHHKRLPPRGITHLDVVCYGLNAPEQANQGYAWAVFCHSTGKCLEYACYPGSRGYLAGDPSTQAVLEALYWIRDKRLLTVECIHVYSQDAVLVGEVHKQRKLRFPCDRNKVETPAVIITRVIHCLEIKEIEVYFEPTRMFITQLAVKYLAQVGSKSKQAFKNIDFDNYLTVGYLQSIHGKISPPVKGKKHRT